MANSAGRHRLIARIIGVLAIAVVAIPAYFIRGGIYFHLVLRFGFLMASIEFVSVVCGSHFVPLCPSEYAITALLFIELYVCLIGGGLSVNLLGGCAFVCVITDTAAYLVGTLIGGKLIKKHPFPKISPHKSYEGLIAGLIAGVVGAYLWRAFAMGPGTPITFWRLALVAPLSVLGDLLESRFKRLYGVKDANDFLINAPVLGWLEKPLGGRDGHGGYFDRLDSLALALFVQLLLP